MSLNKFDTGGDAYSTSLQLSGTGGAGYLEVVSQSSPASAAPTGAVRIFSDANGDLSFIDDGSNRVALSLGGLTSSRTLTFPDAAGALVGVNATQTLTNKTITAAGGNTVDATSIGGAAITGTPTTGQFLQFGGSTWSPQALTAASPITLTGNQFGVTVGSVGGVASFTDARLVTPQKLIVRTGTAGYGEFNSIATAVASISDASTTKRYIVSVGAGVFTEPAITLQPYVYIVGSSRDATKVVPASSGITQFTLASNSSVEDLEYAGTGTGIGFNIDGVDNAYIGGVNAGNATTIVRVAAAGTDTDAIVQDILFNAPFTNAVSVLGANPQSLHQCNVTFTIGRVRGDGSSATAFKIAGQYARVTVDSIRVIGLTSGTAFEISDSAVVQLSAGKATSCSLGLDLPNVGGGPEVYVRDVLFLDNTADIDVANPGAIGVINGITDRNKVTVDPSALVAMNYFDMMNPASVVTGEFIYAPANDTVLTETGSLIVQSAAVGCYTGSVITAGAGLSVDVTGGKGYIVANASTSYMRKIEWPTTNIGSLPANSIQYIYANASGLSFAASPPDATLNIILGRVIIGPTDVQIVDMQLQSNLHPDTNSYVVARETGGVLFASGGVVTLQAFQIGVGYPVDVTGATYYFANNRLVSTGGTGLTMTGYYRNGSGGWTREEGSTALFYYYDDGSGSLQFIPSGKYARFLIYLVGEGVNEQYFYVYGQAVFDTAVAASTDSITVPPTFFNEGITVIAGVVLDNAGSNTVYDLRTLPRSPGNGVVSAATNHGSLTGLTNDDHHQYLLVSGTRAMTGALNMGGQAITNVGNVDGVDVSAHASRHLPNGADPLTTAAPTISVSSTSANATGTANSFARSDHSHALDVSAVGINSLGGILNVNKGGTGVATLDLGNVLVGNGTSAVTTTKAAPAGDFVGTTDVQTLTNKTLDSANTYFAGVSGTITINAIASGTTSIASTSTGTAVLFLPSANDTLTGNAATQTLTNKTINSVTNTVSANLINAVNINTTPPTAGQIIVASSGTAAAWGDITSLSGILSVSNGGTGASSLTANRVLVGNGTATVDLSKIAPTGDFVGTTDVQTVTNKTLAAASTVIRGATGSDTLSFSPTGVTSIVTAGAATLTMPSGTRTIVGRDTTDTLTNKTITDTSNTVAAKQLINLTGVVDVSASAAPIAGYVLTALTATTAAWQAPASGSTFSDAVFAIYDSGDPTKTITFDAAGTTGTSTTLVSAQSGNISVTLPSASTTLVGRDTTDTMTNKTLTAPVIATIVNTGTLTLPSSTDTLVARDTTDTLTNKTLAAASCKFAGTGNVAFTAGGTAATTTTFATAQTANVTLTMPTITDTVVGRLTTDTLSNKTMSMASFAITDTSTRTYDWTATGTSSTTVTLTSAVTASRVLAFPDISDTLVTKTSTDTLTNKSITGGSGGNSVSADSVRAVLVSAVAPTAGQVLAAVDTTNAAWSTPSVSTVTGVLPVANGGTGNSTLTSNGVLVGNGTGAVSTAKAAPSGAFVGTSDTQTLTGKTLTAPIIATIVNTGTLTLPTSTDTLVARNTTDTLTGKTLSYTTNTMDVNTITGLTVTGTPAAGNVIVASSASAGAWGAITLNSASTTGTLPVNKGGTGVATLTSGNVLVGAGTGAVTTTKAAPAGAFVGTTDTQTLTNKTLTAPVIATIVNTGTLTLPTSTDTLVARNTTDTMTNKTMTSATNDIAARSLRTVAISATAPTAGQILTATSGTAAQWSAVPTSRSYLSNSFFVQYAFASLSIFTSITDNSTSAVMLFPGTSKVNLLTLSVAARSDDLLTGFDLRLRDLDSNVTLASFSVDGNVAETYETSTFTNVPVTITRLQLQARARTGTGNLLISGWTLEMSS